MKTTAQLTLLLLSFNFCVQAQVAASLSVCTSNQPRGLLNQQGVSQLATRFYPAVNKTINLLNGFNARLTFPWANSPLYMGLKTSFALGTSYQQVTAQVPDGVPSNTGIALLQVDYDLAQAALVSGIVIPFKFSFLTTGLALGVEQERVQWTNPSAVLGQPGGACSQMQSAFALDLSVHYTYMIHPNMGFLFGVDHLFSHRKGRQVLSNQLLADARFELGLVYRANAIKSKR